jgi:hypothetical protein
MKLGHFPPPSEQKIALIADTLEQNTDEWLALAGKVCSDLIHRGGIDDAPVASWIKKALLTGRSHSHFF